MPPCTTHRGIAVVLLAVACTTFITPLASAWGIDAVGDVSLLRGAAPGTSPLRYDTMGTPTDPAVIVEPPTLVSLPSNTTAVKTAGTAGARAVEEEGQDSNSDRQGSDVTPVNAVLNGSTGSVIVHLDAFEAAYLQLPTPEPHDAVDFVFAMAGAEDAGDSCDGMGVWVASGATRPELMPEYAGRGHASSAGPAASLWSSLLATFQTSIFCREAARVEMQLSVKDTQLHPDYFVLLQVRALSNPPSATPSPSPARTHSAVATPPRPTRCHVTVFYNREPKSQILVSALVLGSLLWLFVVLWGFGIGRNMLRLARTRGGLAQPAPVPLPAVLLLLPHVVCTVVQELGHRGILRFKTWYLGRAGPSQERNLLASHPTSPTSTRRPTAAFGMQRADTEMAETDDDGDDEAHRMLVGDGAARRTSTPPAVPLGVSTAAAVRAEMTATGRTPRVAFDVDAAPAAPTAASAASALDGSSVNAGGEGEGGEGDGGSDSDDEPLCRICKEDGATEVLVAPCRCRGSVRFVHRSCLDRWRLTAAGNASRQNVNNCELCGAEYDQRIAPKAVARRVGIFSATAAGYVAATYAVLVVMSVAFRLTLGEVSCLAPYHSVSYSARVLFLLPSLSAILAVTLSYVLLAVAVQLSLWYRFCTFLDNAAVRTEVRATGVLPTFYTPRLGLHVVIDVLGAVVTVAGLGHVAKVLLYYGSDRVVWSGEPSLGAGLVLLAMSGVVALVVGSVLAARSRGLMIETHGTPDAHDAHATLNSDDADAAAIVTPGDGGEAPVARRAAAAAPGQGSLDSVELTEFRRAPPQSAPLPFVPSPTSTVAPSSAVQVSMPLQQQQQASTMASTTVVVPKSGAKSHKYQQLGNDDDDDVIPARPRPVAVAAEPTMAAAAAALPVGSEEVAGRPRVRPVAPKPAVAADAAAAEGEGETRSLEAEVLRQLPDATVQEAPADILDAALDPTNQASAHGAAGPFDEPRDVASPEDFSV